MRSFVYLELQNSEKARALITRHTGRDKSSASGESLVPLLRHRLISLCDVINIKGLPGLEDIEPDSNGIRIEALTSHRAVENSPIINKDFPGL